MYSLDNCRQENVTVIVIRNGFIYVDTFLAGIMVLVGCMKYRSLSFKSIAGNPTKNLTVYPVPAGSGKYETKFAACSQLMESPTSSKIFCTVYVIIFSTINHGKRRHLFPR
jgi:hypothetical protein